MVSLWGNPRTTLREILIKLRQLIFSGTRNGNCDTTSASQTSRPSRSCQTSHGALPVEKYPLPGSSMYRSTPCVLQVRDVHRSLSTRCTSRTCRTQGVDRYTLDPGKGFWRSENISCRNFIIYPLRTLCVLYKAVNRLSSTIQSNAV